MSTQPKCQSCGKVCEDYEALHRHVKARREGRCGLDFLMTVDFVRGTRAYRESLNRDVFREVTLPFETIDRWRREFRRHGAPKIEHAGRLNDGPPPEVGDGPLTGVV